jgi:hypothetical protein
MLVASLIASAPSESVREFVVGAKPPSHVIPSVTLGSLYMTQVRSSSRIIPTPITTLSPASINNSHPCICTHATAKPESPALHAITRDPHYACPSGLPAFGLRNSQIGLVIVLLSFTSTTQTITHVNPCQSPPRVSLNAPYVTGLNAMRPRRFGSMDTWKAEV